MADVSQAQTVTAALGQELSSIAFALVPARLSRISGTVMGSDGRPLPGAMVMIRARNSGGLGALRMNIVNGGSNQVRPDGSFQLDERAARRLCTRRSAASAKYQEPAGHQPVPAGVRVDARQRVGETSTISPSSPLQA